MLRCITHSHCEIYFAKQFRLSDLSDQQETTEYLKRRHQVSDCSRKNVCATSPHWGTVLYISSNSYFQRLLLISLQLGKYHYRVG